MRVHRVVACLLLIAVPASGQDLFDPLWEGDEGISEDFVEDHDGIVLDLNAASIEDLAALPGLSYADAERIVTFRAARGPFRRTRDLDRVEGLSRPVVEGLLPHLVVNSLKPSQQDLTSRLRFVRRSASARGRSFLTGSSLNARTTVQAGDRVTASVTTDKDAGEGNPFDFTAGYAEIRPASAAGRLVVGDFRPGFAQGLLFSRWGRAPVDLGQIVRRPSGQVGYRSTEENGALRGVYLEGSKGAWRAALLGSSARFDAAFTPSGEVDRLVEGGLHVTDLERSRADALRERALGLRVERTVRRQASLGFTLLRSGFDPPFSAQAHGLSGASATLVGIDGQAALGALTMAGEMAQAGPNRAWTAGAAFHRPRFQAGLQARDYSPRFQTLHGAGFSTFGESQNERGFFTGLAWKARRIRTASLTFDRAWRPGPTTTLPAGASRSSLTLRVWHPLSRSLLIQWSGQARWDQVWKGKQEGVLQRQRRSLRMDIAQSFGRGVRFRGRGEMVNVGMGSDHETGRSVFGALGGRWKNLRAEGRLTYFDASSYESRMFEWEDAPEGMMAFRTLTGRGLKAYGLIAMKIGPARTTLRLWRQQPLDGRKETTEILAQVDVKW
ncbi:MAG: helix-hairpin-helix domain-containing protein [Candidatus Latescibacteria bacterium]|nr:helix-hairpin-helix domain-containing protein [Candidatus Latescibacterota bacterium]